ncbi:MAG: DUF4252 domain-containing protein [Bacteroidota bacterium]
MKLHTLLVFAISTLLLASCNSTKTLDNFYEKHKKEEGVTNFKLPGWLVWIGTGMAYHSIRDREVRMALKMAKKVKTMQFFTTEGDYEVSRAEIDALVGNLKEESFDELLYVKEEGTQVNVMVRDTDTKLKNILLLVEEEGEFTFISMKSRLKYKDLSEYISYYVNDFMGNKPVKKKDKEDKPRA